MREDAWPPVPEGAEVWGVVSIEVLEAEHGPPILRLMGGGVVLCYLTEHEAERVGFAAKCARLRWERENYQQNRKPNPYRG